MEIFAPTAVTVKGSINLKKYPKPGHIDVQLVSEPRERQSENIGAEDRSRYTISKLPPGELKVTLMSEKVEHREKDGSVSHSFGSLATKTVTAKSGETIEVNFD